MTGSSTWSEGGVEDLVRETALRESVVPPEVRWIDAGTSKARFGGRVIELRRKILCDPAEARFVALHELGHVALAHQQPVRAGWHLSAVLAAFSPLVIGPAAAWWTGAPLIDGLAYGAMVVLVLAAVVACRLFHPCEYAADRWAADRGGILTERIARTAYGSTLGWAEQVASLWLPHPPTSRRVRRVQEHLAQDSFPES